MFEMTNYKSAAYTVGTFWATKAVMHYRDPRRRSWYEDSVQPDDLPFNTNVSQLAEQSRLLRLVIEGGEHPMAVRMLSSVTRGPDTVHVGDWVFLQKNEVSMVGHVKGMLQAALKRDEQVVHVVRLFVAHATVPRVGAYNELWSDIAPETAVCVLKFEYVHATVVCRTLAYDHPPYAGLRCKYVY